MTELLWTPAAEAAANTLLGRFWDEARRRSGLPLADYRALHHWSVADSGAFWTQLWHSTGMVGDGALTPACEPAAHPIDSRWFPNLRLNYAENLLRHASERPDAVALVAVDEAGHRNSLTWAELQQRTGRVAAALAARGVSAGDRVAGWLPNGAEAVIAALATSWLGAVWSSCSPDFGPEAVLDRFGQIEPKLLLVAEGVQYNGKWLDLTPRLDKLATGLPGTELVVLRQDTAACPFHAWQHSETALPSYQRQQFDAPLYVMYSSGTTGKPKCIVHGVGGTLLQHAKEHWLHGDLHAEDRFFYYTTCGWMMWNWLVGGLQTGATVVLYDGNPAWPDSSRLFELLEAERITHFGTSAKFIQAVEKSGLVPQERFDLSTLRVLYSTGSPLLDASFDFVYRAISPTVQLSSISGGTDIISCFALGNPLLPVYRGELQCVGLGLDVAVVDEHGQALTDGKGELVCRNAFPSMPVGFWNDQDRSAYRKAYFSRFDGIWAHGDYAALHPHAGHDGITIHGRSDAVLNPGGVRIGTAEIYRQVETLPEIRESVVIGQEWDGDVRVVLFVVLQPGAQLDDALQQQLRQRIRQGASPRHVPAVILAVPEIPRTVSGKIVELAVRDVVHGRPVGNRSALANPDALEHFANRPELT
ncbi:acetoacetate--CoA ligase [Isoalcanivorax beigongshangi]|uniref:Acetoacetate--CoA ligase n=1 Tax=Isoalcanivorax beigongshangi TaxID=3238810 RepID=A0ABV4AGB4_9GAMM